MGQAGKHRYQGRFPIVGFLKFFWKGTDPLSRSAFLDFVLSSRFQQGGEAAGISRPWFRCYLDLLPGGKGDFRRATAQQFLSVENIK